MHGLTGKLELMPPNGAGADQATLDSFLSVGTPSPLTWILMLTAKSAGNCVGTLCSTVEEVLLLGSTQGINEEDAVETLSLPFVGSY